MISAYSLNYPALTAILILLLVGVYHWIFSRRHEYDVVSLPSSLVLASTEEGVSIQHEGDVQINSVLHFDQLICRNLFLGPMASLRGRVLRAERIVVEGEIKSAEQIVASVCLENRNFVEALRIDTPQMKLGKKSVSIIQIVPKETEVHRRRGAQTRGFFSSPDEILRHRQSARPKPRENFAAIRLLRKS